MPISSSFHNVNVSAKDGMQDPHPILPATQETSLRYLPAG